MVAVVSGNGTGLERSSAKLLGDAGQLGSAGVGRANDAVHVNAATGNLVIRNSDEILIGQGPDAVINRTYNSLGAYTNLAGAADPDNWLTNTQRKIVLSGTGNAAGSTATLTDWDGTVIVFTWVSATVGYKATENPYRDDTLTWAGNVFTWTEGKSRTVQTFASNIGGRIVNAADADGNLMTYTYDLTTTAGKLIKVTTINGGGSASNYVDMTYDGSSRLASLVTGYHELSSSTNKTLTRVRYGYDTSNRLTTVTVDLSPNDNVIADAKTYVTTYGYSGTSKLVSSITQSDGTALAIVYDGSNRVSTMTQTVTGVARTTTFTYDTVNRITTITDALNQQSQMYYDASGRLWKTVEPAAIAGGNARTAEFFYDPDSADRDNLLSVKVYDGTTLISAEFSSYDASGNVVERQDLLGNTTRWTYGSKNEVLTETRYTTADVDGIRIESANLKPDLASATNWSVGGASNVAAGNLDGAEARQLTVTANGVAGALTSAAPAIAVAAGDMVKFGLSLKAVGTVTSHVVGLYGSVSGWTSNAAGVVSARIVSGPGSITQTQGGLWTVSGLSATQSTRIELVRTFAQTENAQAYLYVRTSAGAAATAGDSVIVANPEVVKFSAAPLQPTGSMTTRFAYDVENHLRFAVTQEGRVTEYKYDAAGNVIATISYTGTLFPTAGIAANTSISETSLANWVTANADKTQTQRTDNAYDFRGNITTSTSWSKTDAAGAGIATEDWSRLTYVYDQSGRLLSKLVSGTNVLGGEVNAAETFVYDGLGRVISVGDVYGQTTTITINDGTRVTTVSTPNDVTRTSTYNNGGELLSVADSGAGITTGITSYAYDKLGRLRVQTDPLGVKTYYIYDKQSRLTGQIDGDGSLTEFKYDGADRIIATIAYATAVSAANLTTLETATTNTEIATIRPAASAADRWSWSIYDKSGKLTGTIDAAGAVTKLDYDGAGRLTNTTRYNAVLASATVTGYKTTLPTTLTLPTADDASDRPTRNFYDNDGLLIAELDEDGFLTEHVYDKAGRKVETIRYAVTSANHLTAAAQPAYWRTATLAQLKVQATASPTSDIRNFWIYDGRGRVAAVIDGEGNVTRYHYTARGDLDQDIRGQKVTAGAAYTLASLPAATGTLETTRYYRDAAGQMTSQVKYLSGGNTETTSYTYDTRGRLLTQTTSETLSIETRTQRFRYDVKGRLVGSLDGVGAATLVANPTDAQIATAINTYGTRYTYDTSDRLISRIDPDGTGATGNKTLFYYDGDGQLRYEINALGEVTELRYNVLEDRIDTYVYGTRIAPATLTTLTGGLVTGYLSAVVANVALDSLTQSAYDNRGQLTAEYDPLYRASPVAENYRTFAYNAFGELTGTIKTTGGASGQVDGQNNGYFRRGLHYWTQRWLNATSTGSVQQTFGYDAFGNVVVAFDNNTDWRGASYNYDRANRLINEWENVGNTGSYRQLAYDALSNVISSRDRNGKVTTFGYDVTDKNATAIAVGSRTGHYRTTTTTTAEGVVSRVTRNAYGQTIQITDGAGRSTSYVYDENGNLKTVTDAAGTTTNNYDNADRLIETVDAKGVKTRFTYDAANRVLTRVEDYGSGTLNLTTSYVYDAKGQSTSVTDALGVVTTYTYDLKGQKTRIVQDAGAGAGKLNITTDFVYRGDGKVIWQTDAVGTTAERKTFFDYDSMGRLTQKIEDQGNGKLNVVTNYTWDENNNLVATSDNLARVTRFVYDLENRLQFTVNAEGEVTENGYDAEGRVIWTRAYLNRIAAGTLTGFANKITAAQVTGNAATSTNDAITRTLYDGDGRATYAVDGEGYVTRNVYDGANNVIKTIRYDTAATTSNSTVKTDLDTLFGSAASPPATAAVTSYIYDAANRLTDIFDAEGARTQFVMDALGNIVRTIVTKSPPTGMRLPAEGVDRAYYLLNNLDVAAENIDPALHYAQSGWIEGRNPNALFNTTAYLAANPDVAAANINPLEHFLNNGWYEGRLPSAGVTAYDYLIQYGPDSSVTARVFDNLGRVTQETQAFGDAAQATTHFAYNAHGDVTSVTDPRGFVTTRTYDALGRMLSETAPLDASTNATTSYQYDVRGNRVKITDPRGNVGYFYYDGVDRLTLQVDPEGYVTETAYLIGSNVSSVKRYSERANNLASVSVTVKPTLANPSLNATNSFAYDKANRVTSSTDAMGFIESYTYDGLGNRTSLTNKLGGSTTFAYNKNGLLTREIKWQSTYGSGENGVITDYTYDARGNVLSKVTAANIAGNQLTTTYLYDKMDRLLSQTDPAFFNMTPVTAYQYDKRGNVILTTAADGGKTYSTYDDGNRKVSEVSPVGTLTTWTYDANGNVLSQKIYAATVGLPPTPAIIAATIAAASASGYRETNYNYDRNNRLTETKILGVRTGSFDGTNYVTTAAATLNSFNQYDSAGNLVREQDANGNSIYHYFDKNGREIAKVDQEGYLTSWTYDAEGNALNETRFANKFTGALVAGGTPPTVTADGANDRTTAFTYDKNGRRLTETRYNVASATIGTGGAVHTTTDHSTIYYTYNGLGEVTSKTEANSGLRDWFLGYNPHGIATNAWPVEGEHPSVDYAKINFAATAANQVVSVAADYYGPINFSAGDQLAVEVGIEGYGPILRQELKVHYWDVNGTHLGGYDVASMNGAQSLNTRLGGAIGIPAGAVRARVEVYLFTSGAGAGHVVMAEPKINVRKPGQQDVDAFGDQTIYTYDTQGRLIKQLDAANKDVNGGIARHVTNFYYDGNNNLVRTEEKAEAPGGGYPVGYGSADDRVTTYSYNGGKLEWTIDASGFKRTLLYDVMAHVTGEYYTRIKSDLVSTDTARNGNLSLYDVGGRLISQWQADYTGGTWTTVGPITTYSYNQFGEVTARSLENFVQEAYQYDNAGRVVKTNAGDGVWKFLIYDANGNNTLVLQSNGRDLSVATTTIESQLSGTTIAALLAASDLVGTITTYDKRNQATGIREPNRQIDLGAAVTITRSRSYNGFGEVASETDARGFTTSYSYNTMGRLTQKISPQVSMTGENGVATLINPTESYFYDLSGRLVASRDAVSHATGVAYYTTRTLLAGTGHNGTEAKVLKEFRPDGSVWETQYDAFGDARIAIDGVNSAKKAANQAYQTTQSVYDKAHRAIQVTKPSGFTDYFAYDGLGQRIRHWNSLFGAAEAETTDYDIKGQVISSRSFGGDTTTTSFVWNAGLTNAGVGSLGGWIKTTTEANGKTSEERTDYFGRAIRKTDLGGHVVTFNYDRAGRLTQYQDTGSSSTWTMSWFNTGKRNTVTASNGGVTNFTYDVDGNQRSEKLVIGGITYKDQTANYDALGRVITWSELGGSTVPGASLVIKYDAVGNVRARTVTYRTTVGGAQQTFTDWYLYDAMNRITIDRGLLSGGAVVRGITDGPQGIYGGTSYLYNENGDRRLEISSAYYYLNGWDPYHDVHYSNEKILLNYRSDYVYNSDGDIIETGSTNDRFAWGEYGEPGSATNARTITASYTRDAMGRVLVESSSTSTTTNTLNTKSQITQSVTTQGGASTSTTYSFTDSLNVYTLGQVASWTSTQGGSTQTGTNSFAWYEGAEITQKIVSGTGAQAEGVTTFTVDPFGQVTSMNMTGALPESRTYIYDAASQGIVSNGTFYGTTYVDNWYRMGGANMWHYSNRFNPRGGDQDISGSRYTVRAGDTVQSIAMALWGDSSLWYKLAEANALPATASLVEGQQLTVPAGVWRSQQTAQTYIPYDAGRFLGPTDPSPLYPAPVAPKKKCGGLGQILLAVIAAAVTFILPPTGGILGAALNGAIGSAVSQAVGVATGIQEKFSFKSMAIAAISAGTGAGIGDAVSLGGKIVTDVARGALTNVITQGVAVATGLQKKFSWVGVAVGGVVSGVGGVVSRALTGATPANGSTNTFTRADGFGNELVSGMAGGIAGAATRSLIEGSNFGDNLIATLPDVIGSTIGRAVAGEVASSRKSARDESKTALPDRLPTSIELNPPGELGSSTIDYDGIRAALPVLTAGGRSGSLVSRDDGMQISVASTRDLSDYPIDPKGTGTHYNQTLRLLGSEAAMRDLDFYLGEDSTQPGTRAAILRESYGRDPALNRELAEGLWRYPDLSNVSDLAGALFMGLPEEYRDTFVNGAPSAQDREARSIEIDRQATRIANKMVQDIGENFTPLGTIMAGYRLVRDGRNASTGDKITVALSAIGPAAAAFKIGSSLARPASKVVPIGAAERVPPITWVDENVGLRGLAKDYNDSAMGARSNILTKSGQAPALERLMPDGTTRLVKFDGVDGNIMIDRKLSIVTTSKAQGQALRQSEVLSQNGLTGRWEVPTVAQQNRAVKMLNSLNISNISVQVVKPW